MSTIIEKTCSNCKETKPVDEFYVDRTKSSKDGYRSHCKTCIAEYVIKSKQRRSDFKKKYYLDNKEQICSKSLKYHHDNKEAIAIKKAKYYQDNKDTFSSKSIQYYRNNIKSYKAYNKQYRKDNVAAHNASNAKRRSAKLQRTVSWADLQTIKDIYKDCEEVNLAARAAGCIELFVVDHIIPLQGELVSGLHVENNLDIITNSANITKKNSFTPGRYS